MTKSYLIAKAEINHETIVNRSRFICYLFPCQSYQALKKRLTELQIEHPSANHHCYSFVAGKPDDSQRYGFSDDGEPSGTAGRPMLAVLQGSEVGQVAAIVVRYFGGVKLGTGGLQRAYGGSVREALTVLTTEVKVETTEKYLVCDYHHVKDVNHLVDVTASSIKSQDYQEKVKFVLAIPDDQLKLFEQQLLTLSAGSLLLTSVDG